jgi:uncharacterized DUF497 family protein
MKISYDPDKNAANLAKHELSLALAAELAWDEAQARPDHRFDYEEWRMNALAPLGNTLYHVSYVERDGTVRIISLRLANKKEIRDYVGNSYY